MRSDATRGAAREPDARAREGSAARLACASGARTSNVRQPAVNREHVTEIRVRYVETDAMGVLHHSQHLIYFEIGRTEALRAGGGSYAAVEQAGRFLVVVEAGVKYHAPAKYDDLLTLTTRVARVTPAKLEHAYELKRGGTVLATGRTVLACVDGDGRVHRVTDAVPALADLM